MVRVGRSWQRQRCYPAEVSHPFGSNGTTRWYSCISAAVCGREQHLQSHQFPDISYADIDMDDYRESSNDLIKLVDLELSGFHIHSSRMKISCTVTVWICVIGIGIIFSALFSKAYRINTVRTSLEKRAIKTKTTRMRFD